MGGALRSSPVAADPSTTPSCRGVQDCRVSTFSITNTRLEQGTYSHGLVEFIRDFLAERETVEPHELAAWADELRSLSAEGRYFFATTRCFFGVSKPGGTPDA